MKVKEILALAAVLLGRSDLAETVASSQKTEETDALLTCYNVVESEVALDYFPLKRTETFPAPEGELRYTQFSHLPVNICSVGDGTRRGVRFTAYPDYLALEGARDRVEVTYMYAPSKKESDDECEFGDRLPSRLFALGVASEFCLMTKAYPEGKAFALRYRDALQHAGILRRSLSVRSRRWV